MQITQQQYQQAIKSALAAGDQAAAQELAQAAADLYGPPTTTPPALRGFEPEMAARETLRGELEQFGPEVSRRAQNVMGDDPSLLRQLFQAPELALIGTSQAARAGGATLNTYISSWIPNALKEGAEAAYDRVKDTDSFKLAAQAASLGYDGYQAFKEAFPAQAERFETSCLCMFFFV